MSGGLKFLNHHHGIWSASDQWLRVLSDCVYRRQAKKSSKLANNQVQYNIISNISAWVCNRYVGIWWYLMVSVHAGKLRYTGKYLPNKSLLMDVAKLELGSHTWGAPFSPLPGTCQHERHGNDWIDRQFLCDLLQTKTCSKWANDGKCIDLVDWSQPKIHCWFLHLSPYL